MRAYVMARKGILLSSPDVAKMSTSQWLFEYAALREREEREAKILRYTLIGLLGLNILRPEDEHGKPKKVSDMSESELESYMPLTMWMGREDLLKHVNEQIQIEKAIENSNADKQYGEMVAAIDAADGDMEPVFGPVPVGVTTKQSVYDEQLKSLVKEFDSKTEVIEADIEDV